MNNINNYVLYRTKIYSDESRKNYKIHTFPYTDNCYEVIKNKHKNLKLFLITNKNYIKMINNMIDEWSIINIEFDRGGLDKWDMDELKERLHNFKMRKENSKMKLLKFIDWMERSGIFIVSMTIRLKDEHVSKRFNIYRNGIVYSLEEINKVKEMVDTLLK